MTNDVRDWAHTLPVLMEIARLMVDSATYYEALPNVDDGVTRCHYCDYDDGYYLPRHAENCPIPRIEAWLAAIGGDDADSH